MRSLLVGFVAVICITATGCGGGNADKIIGSWTLVKLDGKDAPSGAVDSIEFTKDGKLKTPKEGDLDYKVEGDKITVKEKSKDGKEETKSMTIKKLEGDDLVLYDEKEKVEVQLKRKK